MPGFFVALQLGHPCEAAGEKRADGSIAESAPPRALKLRHGLVNILVNIYSIHLCATSLTRLPNKQKVILVSATTLRKAEQQIESCEHCNVKVPKSLNILDRVTSSDPSAMDYILEQPARCPNCRREIVEKTLVEPV